MKAINKKTGEEVTYEENNGRVIYTFGKGLKNSLATSTFKRKFTINK